MRTRPGNPSPLGPTWDGSGVNFALFSENANNVALCLFDGPDGNSVKDYYALDPRVEDGTGRPAEAQLRDMLEQASRLGLNVRMDLVINHTAFDSPPVALHPDWFRRDRDGRIILHPEGAGPAPGPREHRYAATA